MTKVYIILGVVIALIFLGTGFFVSGKYSANDIRSFLGRQIDTLKTTDTIFSTKYIPGISTTFTKRYRDTTLIPFEVTIQDIEEINRLIKERDSINAVLVKRDVKQYSDVDTCFFTNPKLCLNVRINKLLNDLTGGIAVSASTYSVATEVNNWEIGLTKELSWYNNPWITIPGGMVIGAIVYAILERVLFSQPQVTIIK